MRRCLAGALLLVLLAQSSGVAVAQTASGTSRSGFDLGTAVASIQSAITSSLLFAVVTGTQDRYAAMHAPPPHMMRPTNNLNAAALMARERPLHPQLREGTPERLTMPDRSALDRHHRLLDPLAMRRSTPHQLKPTSLQFSEELPPATGEPILLGTQRVVGALQSTPTGQSVNRTAPAHTLGAKRGGGVKPLTSGAQGTGIEHWWTYEERPIPGIGKAMLNVGTGNLLVAATDFDVHEQGIDLALQRVYNSQSTHDYNGDDGGDPAIYGNLWTNNYDANIVYDPNANTITVYDLDGTACTYTSNGSGGWQPCTGEYATLIPTDSSDCTYAWAKPSGTVYWFHTDATGSGCGLAAAKRGRIQQILARNQNNTITFTYSYDNSGLKTSEHITQIVVNHSDGDTLTMSFGLIPGSSINELTTVTLPDGYSTLDYLYDTSGNLLEVDKPGNNSAFPRPQRPDGSNPPKGDAPETYGYASGSSVLQEACGPRCTVAMWNSATNPSDGGALLFSFDNSARLTQWQFQGVLNFTPDDGTSTILHQGKSTSFTTWYTANFTYGGIACGNNLLGTTTMCDSDGHGTAWEIDNANRVSETREWSGTAEGVWINTFQGWDTSNNLTSTTDANGNVTQYGYDNNTNRGYDCCGNMVEMQLPQVSDITGGPLAPLNYYSYDANFNVIAYCDPVWTQTHGQTWVSSPGGQDNLCSGYANRTVLAYATPSPEPYGCLTNITKPSGYKSDISYPTANNPCGNGLPTEVQADQQITNFDGTTRTPTQDFGYNAQGQLTSYDKGLGADGHYEDSWTLAYDGDNRLKERTNNDAVIGGAITSMSCYYPDGSVFYTETPSQWAADSNPPCPTMQTMLSGTQSPPDHATGYYYDLDGDQTKIWTHKGCSSLMACPAAQSITACKSNTTEPIGTTCKYYDGMDRLVEAAEPYDTRTMQNQQGLQQQLEFYPFRWMNRYIYDLSQSGGSANLQISDSTGTISGIVAYGGLLKTQEYLAQTSGMLARLDKLGNLPNPAWNDVRGTSFDALGRVVSKYELAYGTSAVTTNTYDCSGQIDLLCSSNNGAGQQTSYIYDNINRVKQETFSGPAPQADGPRNYTYDPDGRTASISANSMGAMSYTYDWDGNTTSITEPANEPAASLICYTNYADGLREYLGVGVPNQDSCGSINSQPHPTNGGIEQKRLFSYSYRNDDLLASLQVNWNGVTYFNQQTPPTFSWTYTDSGREYTETDPLTGQVAYYPRTGSATLRTKQYSYDNYGRVSGLNFAEPFTEQSFKYDADDELVNYNSNQMTLNARGELLGNLAQAATLSANGTEMGDGDYQMGAAFNQRAPNGRMVDMRSGMIKAISNPFWALNSGMFAGAGAYVYSYDGAGRQTAATQYPTFPNDWPQGGDTSPAYSQTFDSENHMASTGNTLNFCKPTDTNCTNGVTVTAQWGPDGRQRIVNFQGGVHYNAHWDGDALLFYGGDSGTTTQLYIGKYATMDLAGDLDISDRDQTGEQQTTHAYSTPAQAPWWATNGVWFDSWNIGGARNIWIAKLNEQKTIYPFLVPGTCGYYDSQFEGGTNYPCPFYPEFAMQRPDGYSMVGGYVQGARTYDPTSGQWLTPDAYAGDVHDPMSQKPFMWNNNNPVEWADPSGYDPVEAFEDHMENIGGKISDSFANVARGIGAEAARAARSDAAAGRALAGDVTRGIYRFVSNEGKLYVGKSINVGNRLAQHIRKGFLRAENYATTQVKSITGSNQTLLNAEQKAIEELGGPKGPTSNQRNAVAPQSSRKQQTP